MSRLSHPQTTPIIAASQMHNINSGAMLDPKSMLTLSRTLSSLLHPATPESLPAAQRTLSALRLLPDYPRLLAHHLMHPPVQPPIDPTHIRMFVLLQLLKLSPIEDDTVWWSLVEMYYMGNAKVEGLVREIVVRHVLGGRWREFGGRWGLAALGKWLRLVAGVVQWLRERRVRGGQQVEGLVQELQAVLAGLVEEQPCYWHYCEQVLVHIATLTQFPLAIEHHRLPSTPLSDCLLHFPAHLPQCLHLLLPSTKPHHRQALTLLNDHLLANSQGMLQLYGWEILQVYTQFISGLLKGDDVGLLAQIDEEEQSKLELMLACMNQCRQRLEHCVLSEAQYQYLVLYAYAPQPPSPSLISTLIPQLNTLPHTTLLACLRLLHHHPQPHPDLPSHLLSLRCAQPSLGPLCDMVLCRYAPLLATCIPRGQLWALIQQWAQLLGENWIDMRACSGYPLLCLVEESDWVGQEVWGLLAGVMELVAEEMAGGTSQSQGKTVNGRNQSGRKSSRRGRPAQDWVDCYEVFHKISSICARVLPHCPAPKHLLNNLLRHCFKHSLYTPATAMIYLYNLTHPPNQPTLSFVLNMLDASFWRDKDQEEIGFYGTVLLGLVEAGVGGLDRREVQARLGEVLGDGQSEREGLGGRGAMEGGEGREEKEGRFGME